MAKTAAPPASPIRLASDKSGYVLDGEAVQGFPDQPHLDRRDRSLIAAWAAKFAPRTLSAAQRALLDQSRSQAPKRGDLTRQRELEAERRKRLHDDPLFVFDAFTKAIFEGLPPPDRKLVRNPSSHPALKASTSYPLSVGELAKLVGTTPAKVRNWTSMGLLPASRFGQGEERLYYPASVVRAFDLVAAPQFEKSAARAVAEGRGARLFRLLAGAVGQAADQAPSRLSAELEDLADALARGGNTVQGIAAPAPSRPPRRTH